VRAPLVYNGDLTKAAKNYLPLFSRLLSYGNCFPSVNDKILSFESGSGEGKTHRWLFTRRNFAVYLMKVAALYFEVKEMVR
jgi:hypothetical protein